MAKYEYTCISNSEWQIFKNGCLLGSVHKQVEDVQRPYYLFTSSWPWGWPTDSNPNPAPHSRNRYRYNILELFLKNVPGKKGEFNINSSASLHEQYFDALVACWRLGPKEAETYLQNNPAYTLPQHYAKIEFQSLPSLRSGIKTCIINRIITKVVVINNDKYDVYLPGNGQLVYSPEVGMKPFEIDNMEKWIKTKTHLWRFGDIEDYD